MAENSLIVQTGHAASGVAVARDAPPSDDATARPATAAARPGWRSVAIPTEHGGWGLTLEPGLLGLLVAPSMTAVWLALAAMVAFTARTPLKIVAVDLRRNRMLDRTRLAARIGLAELAVLAVLATLAVNSAAQSFWWPLVLAAPMVAVQTSYEIRSRGRRLVPEVAGSVGICAVAAMAVAADGGSVALALGVWLILAGRAITSVPWVRGQIVRIHGRNPDHRALVSTDVTAVACGAIAAVLEPALLPGALALPVVIAIQRLAARGEPVKPAIQGVIQMFMGFGVVAASALGVALL